MLFLPPFIQINYIRTKIPVNYHKKAMSANCSQNWAAQIQNKKIEIRIKKKARP
mgnify:CR=1 FL=1